MYLLVIYQKYVAGLQTIGFALNYITYFSRYEEVNLIKVVMMIFNNKVGVIPVVKKFKGGFDHVLSVREIIPCRLHLLSPRKYYKAIFAIKKAIIAKKFAIIHCILQIDSS